MSYVHIALSPRCPIINLQGYLAQGVVDVVEKILDSRSETLKNENLIVALNNKGGCLHALQNLLARLEDVKANGPGVVTYGFGHVKSATTILMAAGNWRLLSPYASYGLHSARSVEADGTPSPRAVVREWNDKMAGMYNRYIQGGFPPEVSRPWLTGLRIKVMPPHTVRNYNLCDEVGNIRWLDEALEKHA